MGGDSQIMENKKSQNVWWIWVILGLVINLMTGSNGLLNKTGLVVIALGLYELLSPKMNKWISLVVVAFLLLFYDYALALLAGELR
jgi:hypothetical protein